MNYRLDIQYDGTRYNGWQRQKNTEQTIQGKIEAVLSKMTNMPVEIQGAGRTDAGVHALGQVASVRLDTTHSPDEIRAYLNRYLPEDIGITAVRPVPERFHARLNAVGKHYDYRIATDPSLHILERKYMYPFTEPLNLTSMKAAAAYLTGTHDFQCFCARKIKKSTVRQLDSITFTELPGELCISYLGEGFLYNMVRILTGTLLEIGIGKRSKDSIPVLFASGIRENAGFTAPAQGLVLREVFYDSVSKYI